MFARSRRSSRTARSRSCRIEFRGTARRVSQETISCAAIGENNALPACSAGRNGCGWWLASRCWSSFACSWCSFVILPGGVGWFATVKSRPPRRRPPRRKRRRHNRALAGGRRSDRRGSRSGRRGAGRVPGGHRWHSPNPARRNGAVRSAGGMGEEPVFRPTLPPRHQGPALHQSVRRRGEAPRRVGGAEAGSPHRRGRRKEPLWRPAVRRLGSDGRIARPPILADRAGLPQADARGVWHPSEGDSLPAIS